MDNYINQLSSFFSKYANDLFNNNIISEINSKNISIDYISNSKEGDLASNFYLIIKKKIIKNSFNFESDLNERVKNLNFINNLTISKKGFINLYLKKEFIFESLLYIYKKNFLKDIRFGNNEKINIEFVSANPTGPIHIAHLRGAVFGDVLSNLYEKLGYKVTREYYVNDAGSQIDKLSNSLYKRYNELFGKNIKINEDEYPGNYIIDIAKQIYKNDNDKWLKENQEETINNFKKFAIEHILIGIKSDLELLNINFDIFTHESDIQNSNIINDLFKILNKKNLLYSGILPKPKGDDIDWESREQLLFKSSELFDNQDRALKKSNGEWTYFANDSAYHLHKHKRNFHKLINIWGSDHIGYIPRMKSMIKSISEKENYFEVLTCQIVSLIQNKQKIKMSKRDGNFITLRDVYSNVGKDPIRYYMISTRNETAIDFDLDAVIKKNKDNKVFYCQYAYARACSIINKSKDFNLKKIDINNFEEFYNNISDDELKLLKLIISYPYLLHQSLINNEPHRLVNYLELICSNFHTIWNQGKENQSIRFIDKENITQTNIKLFWIESFRIILFDLFEIIGIDAPEQM